VHLKKSNALLEKAQNVFPAGVNSPVRAFKAVGGSPIFIQRAKGAYLYDVDGRKYIDYLCSWGALILGHAHPKVVSAIRLAATKGTSYGAPHQGETTLAEKIIQKMPYIEMVRFVNSGTEAAMSAIRLARAATRRPKIVKFSGCYHGHADFLLAKAGSGVATFGLPDSAGIPPEITQHTLVAEYNDLEQVRQLFRQEGEEIAAVIIEPVAGNMGVVLPEPGFLSGLGQLTKDNGALLIFDEVITGFRISSGGATVLYDITPDLVCLGKIIGGGLPVGCYGGRRDLMELVAPSGPVYQAGTLSGNPLAMAAGLASLAQLTPKIYARLESLSEKLEKGLLTSLRRFGIAGRVNRVGSMLSLFFTDQKVTNLESANRTNRKLHSQLFHFLLEQGVYLPPSSLEAWFVSNAHTEKDINRTIAAFRNSLKKISQAKDFAKLMA
jgi:glutamate-1-semialdehyde 2,1-aminomutase